MSATTNLELPYIEGGQAQKHVTHNEALRRLDAAIQIAVLDATRTAPPPSPAEGDRHVVAAGAGGAWAGRDACVATFTDGAWEYLAPKAGWCVWSIADDRLLVFDGALWRDARNVSMPAAPLDAMAFNGMQVNGAMEISQENAGNAVTLAATSSLQTKHLLDGVVASFRGSFTASAQQAAAPSGMPATSALRVSVATAQASLGANDELTIQFPIEGVRCSRLLLGTPLASALSIGFWFCAHRPGVYSGAVVNAARTRCYPFSVCAASADAPQWVSLAGAGAVPGDASGTWLKDNGVGLYLCLCLAGGSSRLGVANAWAATSAPGVVGVAGSANGVAATSDVFHISNLIVLPGIELPQAGRAPFAMRPAATEIALCERYYQKTFPAGVAVATGAGLSGAIMYQLIASGANLFAWWYSFRRMRVAPTVSFYNPSASNAKWYDTNTASDSGVAAAYYISEDRMLLANPQVGGDMSGYIAAVHASHDARLS